MIFCFSFVAETTCFTALHLLQSAVLPFYLGTCRLPAHTVTVQLAQPNEGTNWGFKDTSAYDSRSQESKH